MLQILLLSSVLFAAIAVLYASHRAGHTLFVRISAAFAIVSAAILAGLAREMLYPPAPADPATIAIHIDQVSALEQGYRLSGSINNQGDTAISEITARVTLSECVNTPCVTVDERVMTLLIHLPPGARYPLAHVLDMPTHKIEQPVWSASVESARISEAR